MQDHGLGEDCLGEAIVTPPDNVIDSCAQQCEDEFQWNTDICECVTVNICDLACILPAKFDPNNCQCLGPEEWSLLYGERDEELDGQCCPIEDPIDDPVEEDCDCECECNCCCDCDCDCGCDGATECPYGFELIADLGICARIKENPLAQEGETCEGFDETTGMPFPDCAEGFICQNAGQVTIPGAGNICMPTCDDGSVFSSRLGICLTEAESDLAVE